MVLVVGWPAIFPTGLAMMMASHVRRMEALTDEEWFIFVCLVVKIKGYYIQMLSIDNTLIDLIYS